jgi:hypothetical protein
MPSLCSKVQRCDATLLTIEVCPSLKQQRNRILIPNAGSQHKRRPIEIPSRLHQLRLSIQELRHVIHITSSHRVEDLLHHLVCIHDQGHFEE